MNNLNHHIKILKTNPNFIELNNYQLNQNLNILKNNSKFNEWHHKKLIPYAKNDKNSKSVTELILDIEDMINDTFISGAQILNFLISNIK